MSQKADTEPLVEETQMSRDYEILLITLAAEKRDPSYLVRLMEVVQDELGIPYHLLHTLQKADLRKNKDLELLEEQIEELLCLTDYDCLKDLLTALNEDAVVLKLPKGMSTERAAEILKNAKEEEDGR